ncbi:hypothetical protein RHSP_63227 [Rhizobium freirei PRF 81]|uniref:Uncharacterized protein n=1 Tax=Rhizobium freirei PRF 81 TaxID=363754 RepID=N6V3E0_9HYPH|nr:hypothetical protein RHSP_63227 [Rhizobium freirei PRF 81]
MSRFEGWPAVSRTCQLPSYCTEEAGQARKPTASSLRTKGSLFIVDCACISEVSAPVVAIDGNIFLGEVAGPDRRATIAEADIDLYRNILLLHDIRGRFLGIGSVALAVDGNAHVAKPYGQPVAIRHFAGLADSHDDAAPIGVLAGSRGLDQRRIGDRQRDALGGSIVFGARHGDFEHLGRAFAVANDLNGEILKEIVERCAEAGKLRIVGTIDMRLSISRSSAGGKQHQRIGGRGIAINGHGVEAWADAVGQQRLKSGRGNVGIGDDERKHRRHVGRDHAGALGNAVDGDLDAADVGAAGRDLRIGVRGHDRLGGLEPEIVHCILRHRVEHAGKFRCIERLADDAGGGEIDFVFTAADGRSSGLRGQLGRLSALQAGKGIGIAGIDDDGAGAAMGQVLPAEIDRSRRTLRTGEDAGDGCWLVEDHQQDIGAVLVLDAGGCRGHAHAAKRGHGNERFGSERGNGTGHESHLM